VAAAALAGREDPAPALPPSAPTVNTDTLQSDREPTVFTYFFYWYDAETGQHLNEEAGLPVHPPEHPQISWHSVDWYRKELADMGEAEIDVLLATYWPEEDERWSFEGLPYMAEAKNQLADEGTATPDIGLFLATQVLEGLDLTTSYGKTFFFEQIATFFRLVPRDQWAVVDGRPVVWLYFSFFPTAFDQSTFDFVYDAFEREFNVRPYIVREITWDFAVRNNQGERQVIETEPIATEANYKWGAALDGYSEWGSVAAAGPGFDEREIEGRGDAYRPRDDGQWYIDNFRRAIESGKRLLVVETWNEIHEASGVGETQEYGRRYITLTRQLVDEYRQALRTDAEGVAGQR
jgi:hypothetical protein